MTKISAWLALINIALLSLISGHTSAKFAIPCMKSSIQSMQSAESVIQSVPSVITDKQDYAPGDTVFITGSGFEPGESITLQVLHENDPGDNDTSLAHVSWEANADENGDLSSIWIVPTDEDELGATLKLTADGQRSLLHAETTFTDATNSLTPRAGTIAGGTQVTITGSGYTAGATFAVKFGTISVPATRLTSTTLTAVTPAHAAGVVDVTAVINGVDDVPLANGFTYVCTNPSNIIFAESMGSVSTTTTVAAHEGANGFDNDTYTMSGTADVRSSSASTDYPAASANANIFLTAIIGTNFQIAGINTVGFSNVELSFGILKSSTTADGSDLIIEVSSNGVSYTPLAFPLLPVGTGTAGWYYRTAFGSIPSTANLRIRFRQNGTISQYRLDDIRLIASPQITTQPSNATKCVGEAANFSVAAAGSGLNYQWYKGSVAPGNEVGANSNTYTINAVAVSDATAYSVVISSPCSSPVTSNAATLTVNTAPLITTDPNDELACAGGYAAFIATANGTPVPGLQWQVSTDDGENFTSLPGETNSSLAFTSTETQNGYKYRAAFTNTCGTATSNAATLMVNSAPSIVNNPNDETKCAGTIVNFAATATSNPAATVQWQVSTDGGANYNDLFGETSSILSFLTTTSQNGNKYRAVFNNSCGFATTTSATLLILAPTVITDQLIDGSSNNNAQIIYGCAAPTLSVNATGEGTLTYKWFKNATNSNSGGTQVCTISSYTLPGAMPVGTYYYYAELTGTCNTIKSDVFTVIVSPQQADAQNNGALYYTGSSNAWTATATSNSATVTLSAFIRNSMEPGAQCGDIATARVTFETKNSSGIWTPIPGAQNLQVCYIDPTSPEKGGTAAAIVQLNISNNTATQIFDLRVIVSGNYLADPAFGCSQITVSKLVPGGSISGGVTLCGNSATGLLKPSASIPALLGFGVEYAMKQNKIQNPKGKLSLYVASFNDQQGNNTFPEPVWYKITCNAIASLSITNPTATFTSKANVSKYNPHTGELTALEGNCTLVLDVRDNITTGYSNTGDLLGITVYRNAGGIWYSNNWSGVKTLPGNICGGDLTVTGTTAMPTITQAQRMIRGDEQGLGTREFQARVFPNPTEHYFTLTIETNKHGPIIVTVHDVAGRQLYMSTGHPQQQYQFGEALPAGVYRVEIRQGQAQTFIKLVKH